LFATAQNYDAAKKTFKIMLGNIIDNSKKTVLLDEIIQISRLDKNGKEIDTDSGLQFTEEWLKDMGVGIDTIHLIEH
jgi:hypothetical protein